MAWTTPRTWTTGEVVTAAMLNEQVRDNLDAIGAAWTAYTPTWTATTTNPTLGNGTLTGDHMTAGKLVLFRITLTFGSTTTVGSGNYRFSAPSVVDGSAWFPIGQASIQDVSAPTRGFRWVACESGASSSLLLSDASATQVSSATFAWATGDIIHITGAYEAA